MKKLLNQAYEDKWYKVWYRDTFYNGETYVTFQWRRTRQACNS